MAEKSGKINVNTQSLEKKTALITGGSRGMGFACGLKLAQHGARVILVSKNRRNLKQALLKIKKNCPESRISGYVVDVCSTSQIKKCVLRIIKKYRQIDFLLNFAGYNLNYAKLCEARPETKQIANLEKIIQTDFLGTARMIFCVEPVMRRQRSGVIVTMGSTATMEASPHDLLYQTAKGGLRQLVKALACQHRLDKVKGVSIYWVAPGHVHNPSTFKGMSLKRQKQANQEGWLDSWRHIAPVILWLLQGKLKRVSGSTIRLDPHSTALIFREMGERYFPFIP